jgi:hypothetical protein
VECLDELGAVLLLEQLGALLAVAVLARQRAAVGDAQVGGLLDEGSVLAQPVGMAQVEADARVDAALPEVAVGRALVAVLVEQLAEVAEIGAGLVGRDRRVLPPRPVVLPVRWEGRRAEAALA